MSNQDRIAVSNLLIRKVSLNLKPLTEPSNLYRHARQVMAGLTAFSHDLPYIHGDRYRGIYEFFNDERTYCLLQFDPLIEQNSPLRLEIRPTNAGKLGIQRLRRGLIEILGLDYEKVMREAVLTGIETGVEITGASLDEFSFCDELKRNSEIRLDDRGNIYTIFLGAANSKQRVEINNLPARNKEEEPNPNETSHLRIQILTQTKAVQIPIGTLLEFDNPYAGIQIVALPPDPPTGRIAWRGFIDSCRLRGMHAALARIEDDSRRDKFRKRLSKDLAVNWWSPRQVWSQFWPSFERLELFPFPELKVPANA